MDRKILDARDAVQREQHRRSHHRLRRQGRRLANSNAITFYDVTNKMKQGGNYDDFGHGTHVSGLVREKRQLLELILYQGIAPSVQLIEMKVLDKKGAGLTSQRSSTRSYFVVANRSRLHLGVINLSLGHPIYEPAATDPLGTGCRERSREGHHRRGRGRQFRRRRLYRRGRVCRDHVPR